VKSCDPEYQDLYGEPVAQLYWRDPTAAARRVRVSQDPRDAFRPRTYCDLVGDDAELQVGGAMATFDARPALAAVRVPTLVTAGRYDPVCPPKVAHEIAAAFPAGVAQVRVFEKSSHRPWVEENALYFDELEAFLR
jgi:proline iminopeptidase